MKKRVDIKAKILPLGLQSVKIQSNTLIRLVYRRTCVRSCLKRNEVISHCLGDLIETHFSYFSNTLMASKCDPEYIFGLNTKKQKPSLKNIIAQ